MVREKSPDSFHNGMGSSSNHPEPPGPRTLVGQSARQTRAVHGPAGQSSLGVVTATGVMVSPGAVGWVGVMNWFMMTSTSASFHVGMPDPPNIKAVESDESAASAIVTPGAAAAAIPTPSVTANAPIRPM